jgi:hypothetical protein
MQTLARLRLLCVLLVASAPRALTGLQAYLLRWKATLLAGLRALLGAGREEAEALLREPPERRELAARFAAAQLPAWESLRAVSVRVCEAGAWREALLSLEGYERLFDLICYRPSAGRRCELSLMLKSQLLARLALYVDFRSALQAPGLVPGDLGRLRGLYLKSAAGQHSAAAKPSRSGVLEDLWRYTQIDASDARKPNYLLFEARALSLRYDLGVEVLAYIALFGVFLREFLQKMPRQLVDEARTEGELAGLFSEAWRCVLSERGQQAFRPFFSELAALQMGLSVKPRRA